MKWMVSMAGMRFYLLRVALLKLVRVAALRTVQLAFSVCMGFAGVWLLEGFQVIRYDKPALRPDGELARRSTVQDVNPPMRPPDEEPSPEVPPDLRARLPADARSVDSVRYVRRRVGGSSEGAPRRFVRAKNFMEFSSTYQGGGIGFDSQAHQGNQRRFDPIPMGVEKKTEEGSKEHTVEWAYRVLADAEAQGYDPYGSGPKAREAPPSVKDVDVGGRVAARGGAPKGDGGIAGTALEQEARDIIFRHEAEREARRSYWRAMAKRLGWGLLISLIAFLVAAGLSGVLTALAKLAAREPSEEEDLERRTRKLRLCLTLGLLGLVSSAQAATLMGPVQADGCWTLNKEQCARQPACRVDRWSCDYVPAGKTFKETCPHGGKGACKPALPRDLCCSLDAKTCLLFDACRPKDWTCRADKGAACRYGDKGACSPQRAPNTASEPRCDLKDPRGAKSTARPKEPQPVFTLMGYGSQMEFNLRIQNQRRKDLELERKGAELEPADLKGSKTEP